VAHRGVLGQAGLLQRPGAPEPETRHPRLEKKRLRRRAYGDRGLTWKSCTVLGLEAG
jgi:hypothetical protein